MGHKNKTLPRSRRITEKVFSILQWPTEMRVPSQEIRKPIEGDLSNLERAKPVAPREQTDTKK